MPEESEEPTEEKDNSPAPKDYGDRVSSAIEWVLGALGAIAATALGKIALDQLEGGSYEDYRWLLVIMCGIAFAIGVVTLVGAIVSATTVSNASFTYLMTATKPEKRRQELWQSLNTTLLGRDPYLAWSILESLADSKYLMPGASDGDPKARLKSFGTELSRLVALQYKDPTAFLGDGNQVKQLRILDGARQTLIQVAKRARLQQVSRQIPARFLFATVLATVGALGFALVTSEARRIADAQDDEEQKVAAGDLLPKVPSTVRVLFPADLVGRDDLQVRLSSDGLASCNLEEVDGVLVGIESPPREAAADSADVMHVFTLASSGCQSVELRLPPEQVIPPPASSSAEPQDPSSTSPTTTGGD